MAYEHLTGSGAEDAYVAGDRWGAQTAERVRLNLRALSGIRHVLPLGGSRNQGLIHSTVVDAYDYLDVEIDSTEIAGLRVRARVEVRVADASINVTPSIRNVTDGSDVVTGAACAATSADYSGTDQKQTLTVPLTAGVKKYRLRLTPSASTFQCWGIGYIEISYNDDLSLTASSGSLAITGTSVTLTLTT